MKGYVPQVAVEFGRQAVPVRFKPKSVELEDLIKEVRRAEREGSQPKREGGLDEAADRFIASLE